MDANFMNVIAAVEQEIERAKSLHPGDFRSIHEGYAVLLEEVDELWDAVKINPKKLNAVSETIALGIENVVDGYTEAQRFKHRRMLREEAIQVAAMAIRFAAEVC